MTNAELKEATLTPILANKREIINAVIIMIIIVMIAICAFDVSYEFIELTRIFALGGFAWLSYCSFKNNNDVYGFVFGFFSVLFQPLFKVNLGDTLWCIIDIIVVLFLLFIIYKQLISLTRKTFPDFSLRTFFNQKKNEEIVPAAMSTSERVQFLHQYDVVINLVISRLQEDDDDFGFHDFGNEFQREDKGYFSVNELPTDYPKEYEIAYYHGYTVFYPSTRITFSCQSEDASLSVHLEESEWRPMNYPPKPYLGTWFFRKGENMYSFARSIRQAVVDFYANFPKRKWQIP